MTEAATHTIAVTGGTGRIGRAILAEALKRGHKAVFVTERAVFHLENEGLVLSEVAPGVDIRHDILERMDFMPLIPRDPQLMDSAIFTD